MTKLVHTENLELLTTLETAVKTVNATYNSGVKGKFTIGEVLNNAKPNTESSDQDKEAYSSIFDRLPFGETVGDKHIRIYNTKWLRDIAESKSVSNLPDGYNTLVFLTKDEYQKDKNVLEALKKGFTSGSFTIDGDEISSSEMSPSKVSGLVKSVKGETDDSDKPDMTVATIKIKSSTYMTDFKKVGRLQTILGSLKVEDGSVSLSKVNLEKVSKAADQALLEKVKIEEQKKAA